MKQKLLVLAAAAILLVGVGTAFAQGQRRAPRGGHERMFSYLAKQLQLTDTQKAQIKTLWQAEKPTMQPLLKQMADGRQQMMAATAGGAFDQAKVTAIAQAQAQVMAKMMVEKEKLQSQIYNTVLTPDQRVKADQLRQKHQEHMQHRRTKPAEAGAAGGAAQQ